MLYSPKASIVISIAMGQSIKDESLIKAMQTILDEFGVKYKLIEMAKMPSIYYLK